MPRDAEQQGLSEPANKKRVVAPPGEGASEVGQEEETCRSTPEIAFNEDKKKKHEDWWHRQEKALAKWEKKQEEKKEKEKQQQQEGEEPKQQQEHDNEPKDSVEDDSCSWPSTCSLGIELSPGWCVYGEEK